MTTGTIMGSTTSTAGRAAGPNKTIRSFESKGRHFFLKILSFAVGATDGFRGSKDDGFKILTTIQAVVFIYGHRDGLLVFFLP